MKLIATLLLYFMLSSTACACTCVQKFFDEAVALDTDHVFIFRLLDAEVETDPPSNGYDKSSKVIGNIRIVDSLKGDGWKVQKVRFQNSSCCGIRLDVGHYFLVFVSQPTEILNLSEDMVVNINDFYFEGEPETYSAAGIVGSINLMLEGHLAVDEVLPASVRKRISTAPPAPPPRMCPEE